MAPIPTRVATVLSGTLAVLAAGCRPASEPGAARGEAVFDTCVPCHGALGGGSTPLGAPAIAGLPVWYLEAQLRSFQSGWRGAHPMDTVGIRMKSMSLALDTEGDLESVSEYVSALPAQAPPAAAPADGDAHGPGDPAAGQSAFGVCTACHGAQATGNEMMRAPPLTPHAGWYLEAQLRKFRAGWRGAHPDDVWGNTMRPNAQSLSDDAIRNVVAYIETLRRQGREPS